MEVSTLCCVAFLTRKQQQRSPSMMTNQLFTTSLHDALHSMDSPNLSQVATCCRRLQCLVAGCNVASVVRSCATLQQYNSKSVMMDEGKSLKLLEQ